MPSPKGKNSTVFEYYAAISIDFFNVLNRWMYLFLDKKNRHFKK